MKQAFNPYLPFWETVPDGEPHVFGDRVYVYGSHDKLGGDLFCSEDYVCWSAPVDDLGDWRCEGVIYRKAQDPINGAAYDRPLPRIDEMMQDGNALHCLYAPDVAKGNDGRYYLYYALDFCDIISVAVSDSPAGPFEFLEYVAYEDGSQPKIGRKFDPAILVEDSGNYLYYGFCPAFKFPGMDEQSMPGLMMVRLSDDMHTIVSEPVIIANGVDTSKGTSFEEHPAFEASSIRHIGDYYYFVYSSLQGHELCYAMSDSPAGPFEYKGVIVSNGDIGLNGNMQPTNYWGNNHGGLETIGDKTYIFYHRQTHGTEYSRQGCAEEVVLQSNGTIPQVEITSCGLNGGPLKADGIYDTFIACHLTGESINDDSTYSQMENVAGHVLSKRPDDKNPLVIPDNMPIITEESFQDGEKGLKPYIHNFNSGAIVGFKYFEFNGEGTVTLEMRGKGKATVFADGFDDGAMQLCTIDVDSKKWKMYQGNSQGLTGTYSIYVKSLDGDVDFARIGFQK